MKDYILLMHSDTQSSTTEEDWQNYFSKLREAGAFRGGSSIGNGEVTRKAGEPGVLADHLAGYILIGAVDLDSAKDLVRGNPVYECGGSVEVRELPHDS